MKKIHVLLLVLFLMFLGIVSVQAQDEQVPPFAIGLRANPDGAGITAKYFFIPAVSIEAMINGSGGTYYGNGPSTTFLGLIEYNFIFNDPSWRIFIGPGAHVTSWRQYPELKEPRQTLMGLDAIIGVEYVFYEIPIGISLDLKPAMNFGNSVTSFPNNSAGLGVRYYFGNWGRRRANQTPIQDGRSPVQDGR